jgi:hypothetical protein
MPTKRPKRRGGWQATSYVTDDERRAVSDFAHAFEANCHITIMPTSGDDAERISVNPSNGAAYLSLRSRSSKRPPTPTFTPTSSCASRPRIGTSFGGSTAPSSERISSSREIEATSLPTSQSSGETKGQRSSGPYGNAAGGAAPIITRRRARHFAASGSLGTAKRQEIGLRLGVILIQKKKPETERTPHGLRLVKRHLLLAKTGILRKRKSFSAYQIFRPFLERLPVVQSFHTQSHNQNEE